MAKSKKYLKEMELIERIWAEKGVVKMQDKKGNIRNLSVRDALSRATIINNMVKTMPAWHQERVLNMVEQTVQAVLQAKKQQGEDKIAAAIRNAPLGLKADGTPLPTNKIEEALVANMRLTCPSLKEDEIVYMIRSFPEIPLPEKMQKLEMVHKARCAKAVKQESAAPAETP